MTPTETKAAGQLMIDWAEAMEAGKPFEVDEKLHAGIDRNKCIVPAWNWLHYTYRRRPETVTVYVYRGLHGHPYATVNPPSTIDRIPIGQATIELKEPKP